MPPARRGWAPATATTSTDPSATLSFDQAGISTVYGRIFAADGASTDYTITITVSGVPPTATFANSGPVDEGSPVSVGFTNAYDPLTADTEAGFHYSFATSADGLAASYAAAGTAASATLSFDEAGSYTVYGCIYAASGTSSDYQTVVSVYGTPGSTTTVTSSATAGLVYGQSFTLTAMVSGLLSGSVTPTGVVDFYDGTTDLGELALDDTGSGSLSVPALPAGSQSITAVYGGDANFGQSTSAALVVPIAEASTMTVASASTETPTAGESVTLTANVWVTGAGVGTPTGNVEFYDNGSLDLGTGTLDATGTASLTTTALGGGQNLITAVYAGDGNFSGSTSQALDPTEPMSEATVISPTGQWLLNETSGTRANDSVAGNYGTVQGPTDWLGAEPTNYSGGGMYFDGSSYITVPDTSCPRRFGAYNRNRAFGLDRAWRNQPQWRLRYHRPRLHRVPKRGRGGLPADLQGFLRGRRLGWNSLSQGVVRHSRRRPEQRRVGAVDGSLRLSRGRAGGVDPLSQRDGGGFEREQLGGNVRQRTLDDRRNDGCR